jgi:hypothetical protein
MKPKAWQGHNCVLCSEEREALIQYALSQGKPRPGNVALPYARLAKAACQAWDNFHNREHDIFVCERHFVRRGPLTICSNCAHTEPLPLDYQPGKPVSKQASIFDLINTSYE